MSEIVITCDLIARLGPLALACALDDPKMHCLRLDNGVAVASNGYTMAMENIGGFSGVHHFMLSEGLITACKQRRDIHDSITIRINDVIGYGDAIFKYDNYLMANVLLMGAPQTKFDKWHAIAMRAAAPLSASGRGGMYFCKRELELLSNAAPSGEIILETFVDPTIKPVLMIDKNDPNWCAVARPFDSEGVVYNPQFPHWLTRE